MRETGLQATGLSPASRWKWAWRWKNYSSSAWRRMSCAIGDGTPEAPEAETALLKTAFLCIESSGPPQ